MSGYLFESIYYDTVYDYMIYDTIYDIRVLFGVFGVLVDTGILIRSICYIAVRPNVTICMSESWKYMY